MASYNSPSVSATAPRPATFGGPIPIADATAPSGTFAPGTKIQVGTHKVVIQKYFSEGGFAHVYLVKLPKAIDGTDIAVLKRVAVPDKENLANMRTEVETMKKLKGHRPIVTYYDSHASQLKGGGYEVFLLMEFCNGGGLIDFMNTRLQNRLTEPEILKIFSDVAEGVACMHYLKPPLLHRDLKVENVLITTVGGARRFKLCDFGSTAPPRPAATTPAECRLIEDDVQKHTTLQYRSPEMIDVYRKLPIDEKSDIWALGVLLYKLCYYTTPFETQGQLAILNASFKFPAYPVFSDKLKKLISSMLKENPKSRPNIYQALREACLMQGSEPPIKDIYAGRSQSEARRNQQLPSPPINVASPPVVGAVFAPPTQQEQVIPEVVPMRRGRPTNSSQGHASRPSPSPGLTAASDPFAALDGKPQSGHADEISNRFPSLDQFSLLHDGGKFDFDAKSPSQSSPSRDIGQRVTERLADDAFALPPKPASQTVAKPSSAVSRAQSIIASTPALQSANPSSPVIHQPSPTRPVHSNYVSHGTITSPAPPSHSKPSPSPRLMPSDHHRSTSLPRNETHLHPEQRHIPPISPRLNAHSPNASSSRRSLEGGRPTNEAVSRAKSTSSRPRPSSTYLESNIDYLREQEKIKEVIRPSMSSERRPSCSTPDLARPDAVSDDETNIESNVEYLRTLEHEEAGKNHRRHSGGHKTKRTSLPSLSGTKNLLAGRFGDAFKRFEHNASAPPGPRTPSPLNDMDRRDLTPIAGSEATDGRSDDGNVLAEDMENMPPEQRREIERRRLSMEEKRVANAAAEYRKRLADRDSGMPPPKSIGGVSRATSIQNKVRNLLDESQQSSPPKKSAEGYGKYTSNTAPIPPISQFPTTQSAPPTATTQSNNPYTKPAIGRKPISSSPAPVPTSNDLSYPKPRAQPIAGPATASKTGGPRPSAPPKPMHLNSSNTGAASSSNKDILAGAGGKPVIQPRPDMSAQEKEDYLQDFSRRFPSLSGIELVERDIGVSPTSLEVGKGATMSMENRGLSSRDI